jgi:hypothetical protein
LISEKRPGTYGESYRGSVVILDYQLRSPNRMHTQVNKLIVLAESVGCYYPRPVPNQDPQSSAAYSKIISSQVEEAEKMHTRKLTKMKVKNTLTVI